jgi:hypothetical protein
VNLKLVSAVVAGFFAAPAFAAPVTLDFEGTSSFAPIADYYNGGSGTNYGASFGPGAQGLQNDALGPYFSNNPSGSSIMFVSDPDAALNIAQGFFSSVSFYYSSAADATVSLFSGLNGTGDLLGTLSLSANAQQNGCSDSPYCYWGLASLAFSGVAQSIQFSGAVGAGFDDVKFTPVPVPAAGWLLVSGIGLVAANRRRRKNAIQTGE